MSEEGEYSGKRSVTAFWGLEIRHGQLSSQVRQEREPKRYQRHGSEGEDAFADAMSCFGKYDCIHIAKLGTNCQI